MTPDAFDALPDSEQLRMAGLQVYEMSLCDECRVEARYAFDDDMTFLVDDYRCQGCRAKSVVKHSFEREAGDAAPRALDGLRLVVRPKLNGGSRA